VNVYRPKASPAWASLGFISLSLVVVGASLAVATLPVGGLPGLFTLFLGCAGLLLLSWVPTMRYELDDRELRLSCGPVRYRIPLGDIIGVETRDLAVSLWSSMRLPGFALFEVPYADVGRVHMCSTRAAQGVTLIHTADRKYGISPRDEAAFIADLTARLEGGRE